MPRRFYRTRITTSTLSDDNVPPTHTRKTKDAVGESIDEEATPTFIRQRCRSVNIKTTLPRRLYQTTMPRRQHQTTMPRRQHQTTMPRRLHPPGPRQAQSHMTQATQPLAAMAQKV